MESNQTFSPPHVDASRPSLGFPLGTALLLIVIFSLSGIFSCCYHWDKLRSLRRSFTDPEADRGSSSTDKDKLPCTDTKKNQSQSLPVLMPGDHVPKFIALPCPCEPARHQKLQIEVQNPPEKPPGSPVPSHT